MGRADSVLRPATGFTRADAANYYRAVAKVFLPHIRGRPLSFKRYPATIRGESFREKDTPSFTPGWVKRVKVPRRGGDADIQYVVANDIRTLNWMAGVGAVELHPFLHRASKFDQPLEIVFELDPGTGASILECCRVAVLVREALATAGLRSFVKASGSKGSQVYAPLNTPVTHDVTEAFARLIGDEIARRHSRLVVARMSKSLRTGKVFIDWSQNADYKTTVAVYSLRSNRDQPLVSMPMRWREVEKPKSVEQFHFTPEQALRRIERAGDLWAELRTLKQRIAADFVPGRPVNARARSSPTEQGVLLNGIRLPKAKSQSGRRLFVLAKTENGNELWLDRHGKFKRWVLRTDREGGKRLIALPAGDFRVNEEYYRGEVPPEWRSRVSLEDAGAYEIVEGSYAQRRFELFFTGHTLSGAWLLEKITDDNAHRSWALEPGR